MNCNYRISNTIDLSRGLLFLHDLPSPLTQQYQSFAGTFGQSQGGSKQLGYKNCTITWTNMTVRQAKTLRGFVDTAIAGTGLMYMTVHHNDATHGNYDWIDVVGTVHPLTVEEIPTNFSTGRGYQVVEIVLNNITVLNDPANL